jgi:signal transduction histidine kinase
MQFRTKTIAGVAAIEIALLGILVSSTLSTLQTSNQNELKNRIQLGGRLLAAAAKDAVIAQDLGTLQSLTESTLATGQVSAVQILDAQGTVLAQKTALAQPPAIAANYATAALPAQELIKADIPIVAGTVRYGEVKLAVSTATIDHLMVAERRWAAGIAALELLLVAIFSWLLGTYLTRKLDALREASVRIAGGDYAGQLTIHGDDELAQTMSAFNRMTETIRLSHDHLSAENKLRLQAQEKLATALRESSEHASQLQTIFTLTPDGLISFDEMHRVKYANPAALKISGMQETDLLGLSEQALTARLFGTSPTAATASGLAALRRAQPAPGVPLVLAIGNQKRSVEVDLCTSTATTVSQILHLRDVTAEVELNRAKQEFLARIAHELRTPTTIICGYSDLLQNDEWSVQLGREYAALIHRQTILLRDMINQSLELISLQAGGNESLRPASIALQPLLETVVNTMQFDSAVWPIAIENPPREPHVFADADKLRRAVQKIIANAVKYSPRGGAIEITFPRQERDGRRYAGVAVSDHGIGMTAEQIRHLGERFYRADPSGHIPGIGLGISLAKEILELSGGWLEIASTPGRRSTFILWLPAEMPAQTPAAANSLIEQMGTAAPGT